MLSRRTMLAALTGGVLRGQEKSQMFADAEAYERFMGRWSSLLAPQLVEFAGASDRGRLLDVGSGTGALAFAAAKSRTGASVLGIDPSKEYVAYANSRNPYPDRVKFETGDAQQLSFPDGSFESSLSLLVFNFIPDPAKALREVCRVTKSGGRVSAAVWDYGRGMRMLRTFWDAVGRMDHSADKLDERHMPLCRSGELSRLWTKTGLQNVEERPLDIVLQFESFANYWDPFLLGQGPAGAYVKKLDSAQRQRLRTEIKRRLSIKDEKAALSMSARVWAVRGTVAS